MPLPSSFGSNSAPKSLRSLLQIEKQARIHYLDLLKFHGRGGADLNHRPSGYEDYLGAIQALPLPLNAPVMCISAASICQMVQLPFGSEGRFGSNSAPLVHYAYKHVVATLLSIYVAVRGCGQIGVVRFAVLRLRQDAGAVRREAEEKRVQSTRQASRRPRRSGREDDPREPGACGEGGCGVAWPLGFRVRGKAGASHRLGSPFARAAFGGALPERLPPTFPTLPVMQKAGMRHVCTVSQGITNHAKTVACCYYEIAWEEGLRGER